MIPICVFGAGPAGTTVAASVARSGRRVVLVDAARVEEPGRAEHLGPGVSPLAGLRAASVLVAWDKPEPAVRAYLHRPGGTGVNVDRTAFDADLLRQARENSVEVIRDHLVASRWEGEQWRLTFRGRELQASFVVDATGRAAVFARGQGAKVLRGDRLHAIIGRVAVPPPSDPALLIEAGPHGWWYSLGTTTGLTAAYVTDTRASDAERVWRAALADAPLTRERAGDGPVACDVVPAGPGYLSPMFGPGWIAVGDAAAHFDPVWGQGVPFAMNLAARGAEAISVPEGPRLYEGVVLEYVASVAERRAQEYGRVAARFGTPFWTSRSS